MPPLLSSQTRFDIEYYLSRGNIVKDIVSRTGITQQQISKIKRNVIESARDVPYKGPNKGRSGSGPSIVDFCPHGLGVALARSTPLTKSKEIRRKTSGAGRVYREDAEI